MSEASLSLSQKILQIEAALKGGAVPHAFGGALALAYYATPRATIDIDVNVFVDVTRVDEVLGIFEGLGVASVSDEVKQRLARDEQGRLFWDRTPIDLFFSYDHFHESCLDRRVLVPFGAGERIHVLSAEDLIVFKAIFDRSKDWRDIAEACFALGGDLDTGYVRDWLERIVGRDDPRYRRTADAMAEVASSA